MTLSSRFATATLKPSTVVRRPAAKPAATGAAALASLGPQAVGPVAPPTIADVNAPASVPPPDAGYEQTVAALARNRDQTITALGAQRQQGLLRYGYTESAPGVVAFDPSNPYSQAALLKRSYDQAATGNTNSYAARGQLYSGALQNAQNATEFQRGSAQNQLTNSLIDFLTRNTGQVAQAGTAYEAGAGQAMGDMLARAPSNPLYQAAAGAPAPAVSPAAKTAAAKRLPYYAFGKRPQW